MTKRSITLETLELKSGAHNRAVDGMCVMEAVAYFHGDKHTDHPECVSPAIAAFLRSWNDSLKTADRQMLKPYVFKVMGTNTGLADEERRAWMASDWLVRTFAPAWLDLAGLGGRANELRALPELTSSELATAAQPIISKARSEAAAARDAAWAAAWAAARDAARDAAWDAAWAAAWAAADKALADTVTGLQKEALALLDRMIEVGNVAA